MENDHSCSDDATSSFMDDRDVQPSTTEKFGQHHKCCSASQVDTASISASVLSVNRWPSLLGVRSLRTSTYLMLGTSDPSARAALSSMYGSNGRTTPSASSRRIKIGRGMRDIQ